MKAKKVEFYLGREICSPDRSGAFVTAYDISDAYAVVPFAGKLKHNVCRTTCQGESVDVDNYGSWV